jgi:guanylate kinase
MSETDPIPADDLLPRDEEPRARGTLFVVSAPSGAGKTSLVRALLEREEGLWLSVSYTTRAPREGEVDGQHYHFVDHATFEAMVAEDAFVEYARVFDNAYGTAEATLREALAAGDDLILEIDWQGARQVRARFPEAVTVFIVPPSVQALEERLRGRGQDSDETIARRMAQARDELSHYAEYDYLVVNDDFEQALAELHCLVAVERLRLGRQRQRHRAALADMLAEVT